MRTPPLATVAATIDLIVFLRGDGCNVYTRTERIVSARARGVLIDISALEIVDSFIGRMLNNIAAMSRVLDAVCTATWEVTDGSVHQYEGGYAAYVLAQSDAVALMVTFGHRGCHACNCRRHLMNSRACAG